MKRDKQMAIAITAILLLSLGMLVIPACTAGNLVLPLERGTHVANPQVHYQSFGLNSPQQSDGLRQPSMTGAPRQGSNHLGNQVGNGYYGYWGAYPMPDVTCDNKTDVLVTGPQFSESGDIEWRVIAKNGKTGNHLWEESVIAESDEVSSALFAWGARDWEIFAIASWWDYHHGGYMDLYSWDWNWYWDWLFNWDGGDYGDWYKYSKYAPGMADMNGDGKGDVLVWLEQVYYENDTETVTLIAKNGTTGEHLWEEPIGGNAFEAVDLWAYGIPDVSGDGNVDVLAMEYDIAGNESSGEEKETLIVKNGTTGEHLWEENVSEASWNGWVDMYAYAVPDMSGDGKPDVAVLIYTEYADAENFTFIVKNGTNGNHLWEETVTGEDLEYAQGGVVPDLDCDEKPDVLIWYLESNVSTWTITTTTIAKKGTNGTHLWEEAISSTLTEEGTGVTFEPDAGTFCEPCTAVARTELPPGAEPLPSGVEFPYGFFSFSICGLEVGATVNVTITLPGPVPVGIRYWKYSPDGKGAPGGQPGWFSLPIGDDDGDNVIIVTVQDGGIGDLDGVANGDIYDPGAPGIGAERAEEVPALMPLGIAALIGLLSVIVTSRIRRIKKGK